MINSFLVKFLMFASYIYVCVCLLFGCSCLCLHVYVCMQGGGAEGGAFTLSSCLLVNGWSQCTAAVILSSTDNYGLRQ